MVIIEKMVITKNKFIIFGVLILVLAITFVFATHANSPASFGVNQTVGYIYNITINNTNSPAVGNGNITRINITLPTGFLFIINTNSTDNLYNAFNFTNTTNVLSWRNTSADPLINTSGKNNTAFLFNATGPDPGTYTFTVMSVLSNGTTSSSTITVTVNDTLAPYNISFASPTSNAYWNLSQTNIPVNVTATDYSNISRFNVSLWNATATPALVNSSIVSASCSGGSLGNGVCSGYINFISLPYATYFINVTANDTSGNWNLTTSSLGRTITLNATAKLNVTLSTPTSGTSATTTAYNFTFNVSDGSTVGFNAAVNCSLVFDDSILDRLTSVTRNLFMGIYISGLWVKNHTWYINCTDSSNQVVNSSSWTLEVAATAASTTTGGGAASSGQTWTMTYTPSAQEVTSGYTKDLKTKERVKVSINNQGHYIGVTGLTASIATVNIESTPQTASLNIGDTRRFELTNDDYYDLSVTLNSISNSKASLSIKYIKEIITPETQEQEQEQEQEAQAGLGAEAGSKTWIWAVVIVVLVIIIGAGVGVGIKRKKRFFW